MPSIYDWALEKNYVVYLDLALNQFPKTVHSVLKVKLNTIANTTLMLKAVWNKNMYFFKIHFKPLWQYLLVLEVIIHVRNHIGTYSEILFDEICEIEVV